MQLVIDVGNTETVIGAVGPEREVRAHWRVSTQNPRTVEEYAFLLAGLFAGETMAGRDFHRAVIGSVVPSATDVLIPTLTRIGIPSVLVIGPESPLPISLDVEEPRTVGADRIVNTLAARELYRRDTIAVDLGTATTYDCITADGVFVGGVIAPGVSAGLEWLGRRTAKLPQVGLLRPEGVIGRRTETCIRSGIFYGVIDALDGMVDRIREEWQRPDALVVATGGFCEVVAPHSRTVEVVAPHLTLIGLALAGELIGG